MNLSTVGSGRRELLSSETKVDQNGGVQGEQFWPQLYGAFQLSGLSTSAMYKISIGRLHRLSVTLALSACPSVRRYSTSRDQLKTYCSARSLATTHPTRNKTHVPRSQTRYENLPLTWKARRGSARNFGTLINRHTLSRSPGLLFSLPLRPTSLSR